MQTKDAPLIGGERTPVKLFRVCFVCCVDCVLCCVVLNVLNVWGVWGVLCCGVVHGFERTCLRTVRAYRGPRENGEENLASASAAEGQRR